MVNLNTCLFSRQIHNHFFNCNTVFSLSSNIFVTPMLIADIGIYDSRANRPNSIELRRSYPAEQIDGSMPGYAPTSPGGGIHHQQQQQQMMMMNAGHYQQGQQYHQVQQQPSEFKNQSKETHFVFFYKHNLEFIGDFFFFKYFFSLPLSPQCTTKTFTIAQRTNRLLSTELTTARLVPCRRRAYTVQEHRHARGHDPPNRHPLPRPVALPLHSQMQTPRHADAACPRAGIRCPRRRQCPRE